MSASRPRVSAGLLIACLATALNAHAGPLQGRPVQASTLDKVRGGFSSSDGQTLVSFGIQRSVYINGELAASNSFHVGNTQGNATAAGEATTLLVQQGAGNTFVAGSFGAASARTIIQNTLDNQKIQTLTAIDVTANSMQVYRNSRIQTTLGNAIAASLRR